MTFSIEEIEAWSKEEGGVTASWVVLEMCAEIRKLRQALVDKGGRSIGGGRVKLKHKLSGEYAAPRAGFESLQMDIAKAYLAGFEKCQDLAIKEYLKTSKEFFITRLEKLGEEEVE